jgi:serine/threonine protein phosphatase 1
MHMLVPSGTDGAERVLAWKMLPSGLRKKKPTVPAGNRVYAIGDVHGRADLLSEVFTRIDHDLILRPAAKIVQVLLGDYVDRGPNSREVIDLLLARQARHEVQLLKGNHETYPIRFLSDPTVLSEWRHMGGISTLLSYGVRPTGSNDLQSQQEAAMAFRDSIPDSHRRLLQSLKLSFTCGDFFFVHAGVRPGTSLKRQSEHDLLWIREDFLLHEEHFGKIIVHGHTPAKEPDVRPNRINIDTGAYATGQLTCLVLEEDRINFI